MCGVNNLLKFAKSVVKAAEGYINIQSGTLICERIANSVGENWCLQKNWRDFKSEFKIAFTRCDQILKY